MELSNELFDCLGAEPFTIKFELQKLSIDRKASADKRNAECRCY